MLDSVAYFTKAASDPRHPVPKSVTSDSFGGIDIRVPPYRLVYVFCLDIFILIME